MFSVSVPPSYRMAAPLPSATTAPLMSKPLIVTLTPLPPSSMMALPFGGVTVASIFTTPPTACSVMFLYTVTKSLV